MLYITTFIRVMLCIVLNMECTFMNTQPLSNFRIGRKRRKSPIFRAESVNSWPNWLKIKDWAECLRADRLSRRPALSVPLARHN